eukprot:3770174-Rhodomonas_salina.3
MSVESRRSSGTANSTIYTRSYQTWRTRYARACLIKVQAVAPYTRSVQETAVATTLGGYFKNTRDSIATYVRLKGVQKMA